MIRSYLDDIAAFVSVGLFTACLWVWIGLATGV